jgi:hypothetical protein
MYEAKTKVTDKSVLEFIESIPDVKKKEDAFKLLDLFTEATGNKAKMWGDSMIGFGSYNYKYPSGHHGEAMLTGFSPRKGKFSLYLDLWAEECEKSLSKLGKHEKGKGCLYIKKLDDINLEVLKQMIQISFNSSKGGYRI